MMSPTGRSMQDRAPRGINNRKFTLDDLWRHATRGRVANVMRPYIEAITA